MKTLSFQVKEIRQVLPHWSSTTPVYETVLRYFATEQELIIRGNPWPIGSKVDFRICNVETPTQP